MPFVGIDLCPDGSPLGGSWCKQAVPATPANEEAQKSENGAELVDEDRPKIPHHREGQALPLDRAVVLVKRV